MLSSLQMTSVALDIEAFEFQIPLLSFPTGLK